MTRTTYRPYIVTLLFTALLLNACNLPVPIANTQATQAPASEEAASAGASPAIGLPTPPADGVFVQILAANPPAANGLSPSDTLALTIRYRLAKNGILQIWFERFTDANCTNPDTSPRPGEDKGGSTIPGGVMQPINSGNLEALFVIPPIPPMDASYVSMGVRLWSEDTATALAEDVRYANCYPVRGLPPAYGATPGLGAAATGSGTIAGIVYQDQNRSGNQDASEPGEPTYPVILSTASCTDTLAAISPDANGHFSFPGLLAGTYCVVLNYSGRPIAPGTWQRVDVAENSSSPAFFGIQPAERRPAASVCGNGTIETGEECDPPNVTNCTASCQQYIASCGNGVVDPGEQCDPPNMLNCTASCQNYIPVCGNGIIDWGIGESCDPPNVSDCTASCQSYTATCGNGIVDPGEQCDPPNMMNCTASCQNYTPVCGNGILDAGEQCDPPNVINCTASCRNYVAACGNGIVDAGEACDPPNTTNCTASCQNYTPICGNGIVDWGETCDPPNTVDCTASCQTWP